MHPIAPASCSVPALMPQSRTGFPSPNQSLQYGQQRRRRRPRPPLEGLPQSPPSAPAPPAESTSDMRDAASMSDPPDENTSLLRPSRSRIRIPGSDTPSRPGLLSRNQSHQSPSCPTLSFHSTSLSSKSTAPNPFVDSSYYGSTRHHSRHGSLSRRLVQALTERQESMTESKFSTTPDERTWYDQFTCTDWVHDSIADAHRVKQLRNRKDWRAGSLCCSMAPRAGY